MTIESVTFDEDETVKDGFDKYNALVTDLKSAGIASSAGVMKLYQSASALGDDETIELPDASYGDLFVVFGTDWLHAAIDSDGTVTLLMWKGSVKATDTDTYFCVYDSANRAIVKNRTGASVKVAVTFNYYIP